MVMNVDSGNQVAVRRGDDAIMKSGECGWSQGDAGQIAGRHQL